MRRTSYLEGYKERLNEACIRSGLTKSEIARRIGCNRLTIYGKYSMHMVYLARFCAVTNTDANWLLGLTNEVQA